MNRLTERTSAEIRGLINAIRRDDFRSIPMSDDEILLSIIIHTRRKWESKMRPKRLMQTLRRIRQQNRKGNRFLILDATSNCETLYWWKPNGSGVTSFIDKAGRYTKDDLMNHGDHCNNHNEAYAIPEDAVLGLASSFVLNNNFRHLKAAAVPKGWDGGYRSPSDLFLILSIKDRDSAGDNLVWYGPDFSGYTTLLREAGRYTFEQVEDYIDRKENDVFIVEERSVMAAGDEVVRRELLGYLRDHFVT